MFKGGRSYGGVENANRSRVSVKKNFQALKKTFDMPSDTSLARKVTVTHGNVPVDVRKVPFRTKEQRLRGWINSRRREYESNYPCTK